MLQFSVPAFELSKTTSTQLAPSDLHPFYLVPKKGDVSFITSQGLPTYLKTHPALRGDRGAKVVVHGHPGKFIVGIGALQEFTPQEACDHAESWGHWLNAEHVSEVQIVLPDSLTDRAVLFNLVKGFAMANYRVDELKGSKSDSHRPELKKVVFTGPGALILKKEDLQKAHVLAKALGFARTIAELPTNFADPEQVVKRFKAAAGSKLEIEVWDEKKIAKEGMGLVQAVAQGSSSPARFLIVRYGSQLKSKKGPLFLVGKGVTFDTGGINLKVIPYRDLVAMKGDMAGAAAVLGAMLAIAELKPKHPVVAVTPLVINAISGNAVIPGDIIRSYAGKTVEILNTDAEGRLILADAVHYAVTQKASAIVDVATLTGACAIALGEYHTGLFTNSRNLGDEILSVSEKCGEPAWLMPTSARYGEELKSSLADLSNMGKGRNGGASLAAKFIEAFVGQTPWAHLDIAGTADHCAPAHGSAQVKASGRMVHTLVDLAMNR